MHPNFSKANQEKNFSEKSNNIKHDEINIIIAVGEMVICLALYFLGTTFELRNFSLTTQQGKFFICSMECGLLLEAARLVVFRLVGCLRRNGLAGC